MNMDDEEVKELLGKWRAMKMTGARINNKAAALDNAATIARINGEVCQKSLIGLE